MEMGIAGRVFDHAGDFEQRRSGNVHSNHLADGVELPEGTARIVYATGSLADGSFGLVVQDIAGLGETPGGVPTGDLSSSGLPLWVFLAGGFALLALAATPVVASRRSR